MNSVSPRSTASLDRLDLRGIGAVEHVEARPAAAAGRTSRPALRAQARSAHAEQHDVREAALLHVVGEALQPWRYRPARASTMSSQPSHLSSSAPVQSVLSPAQSRRIVPSLRQASIFVVEGRLQSRQSRRADRSGGVIALDQRAPAPRDGAEQLVERVGELLHAVLDQLVGDLARARCRPLQRRRGSRARPSTSCSMASGIAFPWSRNASIVAGGMVLTVSRPISASTYMVS